MRQCPRCDAEAYPYCSHPTYHNDGSPVVRVQYHAGTDAWYVEDAILTTGPYQSFTQARDVKRDREWRYATAMLRKGF